MNCISYSCAVPTARSGCHTVSWMVVCRNTASFSLGLTLLAMVAGCGGASDPANRGDDGGVNDGSTGGPDGSVNGEGIAAGYQGDVGIDAHPSVIFFEDFEDPNVDVLGQGWDTVSRADTLSLTSDVPAAAAPGSQGLEMAVPPGSGITGVTLYKSLPNQQGSVHVRYYAKYNDRSDYHHTGMWMGGFNPPTQWPQGTAGITPNGSDFFHNALETTNGGLELEQYAQWPGMDCWMPTPSCYGNHMMRGGRPSVSSDEWNCIELMLKLNTPGQSDGEFAVWINDALIQHTRPGSPSFERSGTGWWTLDPGGEPFPGFNWRNTADLGLNWVWLDFYVDSGPSSMSWDQVVVATERIGCM